MTGERPDTHVSFYPSLSFCLMCNIQTLLSNVLLEANAVYLTQHSTERVILYARRCPRCERMFYVDGPKYFVYRKKLVLSTKMLLNWFTQHYLGSSPVESIIRDLKFSA